MVTPADAEAVYRAYIAGENERDRAAMEACLSETMSVAINGVAQLADRDADAEATDRLLAMYPDYRRGVVDLHVVYDADHVDHHADHAIVVAEWTMRGRSATGDVPDLDTAGCTIATIAEVDGRPVITKARLYLDPAALSHVL
ncbi:MAG: hypothetical protein R2705_06870 [Ilumatobacteraceae bacterium]